MYIRNSLVSRQAECQLEVCKDRLDDRLHALLASERKPIDERTTDCINSSATRERAGIVQALTQDSLRSKGDGAEQIRARPDPRVEQNSELAARLRFLDLGGLHDTLQGEQSRYGPVNLSAAVVRDDNPVNTLVDRDLCVLRQCQFTDPRKRRPDIPRRS